MSFLKNIGILSLLLFSSFLTPTAFSQSESASPDIGSLRENPNNPLVEIQTSMGNIILELFPEEAPQTVANFIELAEGRKPFVDPESGEMITRRYFDGQVFHRVIDDFMIQEAARPVWEMALQVTILQMRLTPVAWGWTE